MLPTHVEFLGPLARDAAAGARARAIARDFLVLFSLFRQGPRRARVHAESPLEGANAIIVRGQLLASNAPVSAMSSRALFARLGGRERSSPQRRCSERQWFLSVGSA